jgi:hypothetical protein
MPEVEVVWGSSYQQNFIGRLCSPAFVNVYLWGHIPLGDVGGAFPYFLCFPVQIF